MRHDSLNSKLLFLPYATDFNTVQAFVHDVAVFYRTSPRHKLSIVRALQVIHVDAGMHMAVQGTWARV